MEFNPNNFQKKAREDSLDAFGVSMHSLTNVVQARGKLSFIEFQKEIPFLPKRCFFIYDVPNSEIRAGHAHKTCQQFLICIQGSVLLKIFNDKGCKEILLDNLQQGIYLPSVAWVSLHEFTRDAVLVCFASEYYDQDDYIYDYSSWQKYSERTI